MYKFDGRTIKLGDRNPEAIRQMKLALIARGYGPLQDSSKFDKATISVVKLYQAQNVDALGRPLVVDGEVGIYTWASLFPQAPEFSTWGASYSPLMMQAVAVAGTQLDVREDPVRPNRGAMVDTYLTNAGLDPSTGGAGGYPWCMAFVYWTFCEAAKSLSQKCPVPKTASVSKHWTSSAKVPGAIRISKDDAYSNNSLVQPGAIFVLDFGSGLGHTGIVESLRSGGILTTIEGNSNDDGSRNGVGVFRLTRRKLNDEHLVGFINYSKC